MRQIDEFLQMTWSDPFLWWTDPLHRFEVCKDVGGPYRGLAVALTSLSLKWLLAFLSWNGWCSKCNLFGNIDSSLTWHIFLHIMDFSRSWKSPPRISELGPTIVTSSPSKVGECVKWPPWEFLLRRTSTAPGGVKLAWKSIFSWTSMWKQKEQRKTSIQFDLQKAECKL